MNDPSYNSSHRAFVQAFFSRGTMTYDDAKPILASILSVHDGRPTLPNDITPDTFTSYIHTLNSALSPFDYEIRSMHAQSAPSRSSDTAIWALVNATSDPQTQLATTRNAAELAFIKRVLDGIFDTNNSVAREVMAIRMTAALKLARPIRGEDDTQTHTQTQTQIHDTQIGETQTTSSTSQAGVLKQTQAEALLLGLVDEGWFEQSNTGFFSLTPRALMELKGWLVDTYNDTTEPLELDEDESTVTGASAADVWQRIKHCHGCKQIITDGQRCSRQACLCRLHDFCVTTGFRGRLSRKCPMCETEWRGESFVGERAAARDGGVDNRRGSSRR